MSLVFGNVLRFGGNISLGKRKDYLVMLLVFWRFLGFLLFFLLLTCFVVVFFVSLPFPPSSPTFLFFFVFVVLSFSMSFTHLYSFHFLLMGIVFVLFSLMCVGGFRHFKNAIDVMGKVQSSWVNVTEMCVCWTRISCEKGMYTSCDCQELVQWTVYPWGTCHYYTNCMCWTYKTICWWFVSLKIWAIAPICRCYFGEQCIIGCFAFLLESMAPSQARQLELQQFERTHSWIYQCFFSCLFPRFS